MASYDSPMQGTGYAEDAPSIAEHIRGADFHDLLNTISGIDSQIIELQNRRRNLVTVFEDSMNNVNQHYKETIEMVKPQF